ncbi:hypothetical protein [Desulfatitalea alkaliphila]|uniref:Uncharacterized protein n=1 Tax=Desulfatitalea alkaliphila TaxID=2929485 RepID=A0AA41UIF0_9BACT|nr:hypothetical protein [Desulfatitalea alkaliphila]MCJ8500715.1 hypothetical protein [Desulfatitalea alkaliphila]
MKHQQSTISFLLDHLDCFGDFSKTNPLCAKHCVLRLRCAIEQDYAVRMEVLDEMATAEHVTFTIQ